MRRDSTGGGTSAYSVHDRRAVDVMACGRDGARGPSLRADGALSLQRVQIEAALSCRVSGGPLTSNCRYGHIPP